MSLDTVTEKELLGLLIWREAGGEPIEGQVAVASVVRNRVMRRRTGYRKEILKPWQFSCFNANDPNRVKIDLAAANMAVAVARDGALRQALWVASGCIDGAMRDNTKGADHYATLARLREPEPPSWADPAKQVAVIGRHAFFRLEG